MSITFEGPAVFVADMDRSRHFYESILKQEVMADFVENLLFTSGFSIWRAGHATSVIYKGKRKTQATLGHDNLELYFETAELDATWEAVSSQWDDIIHPIEEAPWGQRGFRLHDPDGHIVEVAEPLPVLIKRLLVEGLTPEEVSKRTSVPVDMVNAMSK